MATTMRVALMKTSVRGLALARPSAAIARRPYRAAAPVRAGTNFVS